MMSLLKDIDNTKPAPIQESEFRMKDKVEVKAAASDNYGEKAIILQMDPDNKRAHIVYEKGGKKEWIDLRHLMKARKVSEAKSLMQELSVVNAPRGVQTSLKKSDATDAGASDVIDKARAAADVSFSLMRNTINSDGKVSGSEVADYIEKAEELNDEVDTVPFGLETDDGQIVKVYVNAEQADGFEEAMKNMLGLEDDIEEAINRLTTEFDIVDVVWPKTDDDGDGEPDPDADLTIDDTSNLQFDPEDDADFADDNYDVIAAVDDKKSADSGDDDEITAAAKADDDGDDDEPAKGKDGDDEDANADDVEADSNAEEPDEEEELDADGNPIPKKKKKKKKKAQPAEPVDDEDTPVKEDLTADDEHDNKLTSLEKREMEQENDMTTFGTRFLSRLQEAEDRDGVKDGFNIPLDSQARALAAKLKLPLAKRLVAFHVMAGVPGRYLNAEDAEGTISAAADMLRKRVSVRRAFTDLYDGLANAKGYAVPQETNESLNEDYDPKGSMKWAQQLAAKIKSEFNVSVDTKQAEDGSVTVTANQGHLAQSDSGSSSITMKNFNDLIDADFRSARSKGNFFSQPRGASFTVGVKAGAVAEERVYEGKQKRGSFIQKLFETVLVELGLPQSLVTTSGPTAVGTGLYRTAQLIEEDGSLERALRLLATRIGIKQSDAAQTVEEAFFTKNTGKMDKDKAIKKARAIRDILGSGGGHAQVNDSGDKAWIQIKADKDNKEKIERILAEDELSEKKKAPMLGKKAGLDKLGKETSDEKESKKKTKGLGEGLSRLAAMSEAVDVGNDDFAEAVVGLVIALGIPEDLIQRRKTQVIQALRQKKATLKSRQQVLTMIGRLQTIITNNTVEKNGQQQQQQNDEGDDGATQ